jgi:tetratricopeptide (TPR) repeat protein
MLPRRLLASALAVAAAACGPQASHPAARVAAPVAAPSAKPVANEDDYGAERAEFDALPLDAADRAPRREALLTYLVRQVNDALDRNHPEDAYESFKSALTLFDAVELRAPVASPAFAAAARRIEAAFKKRGAHEAVLTALAVELALGDDPAARARYDEVVTWLRNGGATETELGGPLDGRGRVIDDLEKLAAIWPAPLVVEQLTRLYVERHEAGSIADALGAARRGHHTNDLRALLAATGPHPSTAYDLMRLYLRVSDPERALAEIRKLKPPFSPGDDQVVKLLEHYLAKQPTPADAINLAKELAQPGREDFDVAERVCSDGARRFPKAAEPRLCAGQLAMGRDRLVVALRHFEQARLLQPGDRKIWENLAQLYERRLGQLVSDENLNVAALDPHLREVEAFHAAAAKQFPGEPLHPSMAGALFAVGLGYFNVGRVDRALEFLQRSVGVEPTARALEKMGQIRLKKGDAREAIALFERAIAVPKGDRGEEVYFHALMRRNIAEAFDVLGDVAQAESARKQALADWDVLTGIGLTADGKAEAGIERAKLYYALGDRDEALASFESAIDAAPDRAGTYADVIAFLIPRGELDEALDAYHRALGRNEVTEYLKVYCSLWIMDLAARAHQPPDPLATSYLSSMDGNKWYDDLARWATGRETDQTLLSRIDTPAKKAESSFYRALRASSQGKLDDARKLWQDVLGTDMMAFFEYDMAQLYLTLGDAPARPILKSKPSTAKPAPPTTPRPPDGSI